MALGYGVSLKAKSSELSGVKPMIESTADILMKGLQSISAMIIKFVHFVSFVLPQGFALT